MAVEWVRLQLDLEAFEEAPFEPYLQGCRQAGIDFTTMSDLGDTAICRHALYELNKTCSADIPERGDFYTFDEYLTDRIEIPTYHPGGVVLAISNDVWIGMAATSLHPSVGYAFSEMTGVLPSHRGQGLSLAMKLLAIRFVRSTEMRWLRTFHHPHNKAAIAMNRRLGFEPTGAPGGPAACDRSDRRNRRASAQGGPRDTESQVVDLKGRVAAAPH